MTKPKWADRLGALQDEFDEKSGTSFFAEWPDFLFCKLTDAEAEQEQFLSLVCKYQCNPTGQLSNFEAIRNHLEVAHRLCNENYDWAKRSEAELARLQWQPISPENLPKVGDELLAVWRLRVMVMPDGYAPTSPMPEDFTCAGWTHFRPINPPKETA